MGQEREVELYRNDDWSVSTDGLEHRGTGYFIDRSVIAARRDERLWDWPLQMAEKRWCRPSLFRDAFLAALRCFGVAADSDLTRSFALGYGIRAVAEPPGAGFVALADVLRSRATAQATPVRPPVRMPLAVGA